MPAVIMEPASSMHSEPGGFVFGRCGRTKKIKLYGKKAETQHYRGAGGVTIIRLDRKIDHRFGSESRALFGFNPVVDDISAGNKAA